MYFELTLFNFSLELYTLNSLCYIFSSELSTLNSLVLFLAQSCGFPGEIENGWRTGYAFTYPNKVRYYCRDGFELRGLGYRDCQVDGAWSGSVPTCVGTNETLNFFIIKTFFR